MKRKHTKINQDEPEMYDHRIWNNASRLLTVLVCSYSRPGGIDWPFHIVALGLILGCEYPLCFYSLQLFHVICMLKSYYSWKNYPIYLEWQRQRIETGEIWKKNSLRERTERDRFYRDGMGWKLKFHHVLTSVASSDLYWIGRNGITFSEMEQNQNGKW